VPNVDYVRLNDAKLVSLGPVVWWKHPRSSGTGAGRISTLKGVEKEKYLRDGWCVEVSGSSLCV